MTTKFPVYENIKCEYAKDIISKQGFISFKPWGDPFAPSSTGLRRLWDTRNSFGSTDGAIYIPEQCGDDSDEYKAAYKYLLEITKNKFYVSGY